MRAHRRLRPSASLAQDDAHREGCRTSIDVNGGTTGEVDNSRITDAQLADPASAPHPVGHGEVDEGSPDGSEDDPRTELHPVGEGAGDESDGQTGEHCLEHHVNHDGEVVAFSWRSECCLESEVVGDVSDEVAGSGAVGHRVAVDRPQNADDE